MATTTKKITGNLNIATADYKEVKWVGKTKAGDPVIIKLSNAINLSNLEWTLADKDEVVASAEYEACYEEHNGSTDITSEPWEVQYPSGGTGNENIILGYGTFYIGETAVGLCRGGGSFKVEREYRPIEADGDKGTVKDRVVIDSSKAKLSMNVLHVLTCIADFYPGITVSAVTQG